jgi:ariadne-1
MSLDDDDAGSYELEYDDGDDGEGYQLDDTEADADVGFEGSEDSGGPISTDAADAMTGSGAGATDGVGSSALVTVTTRELEAQLAGLLQRVKELLSCSDDEALLLLHVFSWDVRKLEERIWEDGLRERLGVSAAPDPRPLPDGCGPTDTFFDATLMEDVAYADADACACGHFFSRDTWSGHLAEALANPAAALGWLCPASQEGCRECVRPRLFRKFLSPPQMARFHEFVLRALASKSPNMRWCPAPGCESVVFSPACIAQDVACPVGHTFCFQCRGAAHKPASCAELARWMQKEVDESGNAKWLLAHTKPCPQWCVATRATRFVCLSRLQGHAVVSVRVCVPALPSA